MYESEEIKNHIWIIPLIAGILLIIAIFTPTAHFDSGVITWDFWMWNLTWLRLARDEPLIISFVSEGDYIILSMITTIAVVLFAINLFILSIISKRKNFNKTIFELVSILSAILTISFIVYYIIAMGIAFLDGVTIGGFTFPAGMQFWGLFGAAPSFGIFLTFASAVLSFIGVGLLEYLENRKNDIIPPNLDISQKHIPYSRRIGRPNFCTKCGKKIPHTNVKFCTNCGIKFQDHV